MKINKIFGMIAPDPKLRSIPNNLVPVKIKTTETSAKIFAKINFVLFFMQFKEFDLIKFF